MGVHFIVVQLLFRLPQPNDHWMYNNHLRRKAPQLYIYS